MVVAAVAAAVASTNVAVDIVAFVADETTKLDCTNWLNWWHS